MSIGNIPLFVGQQILAGIILVGRSWAYEHGRPSGAAMTKRTGTSRAWPLGGTTCLTLLV